MCSFPTWIGIGNALIGSLLAWRILGRRTRVMSKHLSATTMPDYFGKRYDSNALRIAASAISFIFLIPYTASVYNGLSRLFGMAFDIPYAACVIAMAVLTGVYVIMGGYLATAINDFIQGIIMLVGIIAVILAVIMGVDTVVSVKAAVDLKKILQQITENNEEIKRLQKRLDVFIAVAEDEKEKLRASIEEKISEGRAILAQSKTIPRWQIIANPTAKSKHFMEALEQFREHIHKIANH